MKLRFLELVCLSTLILFSQSAFGAPAGCIGGAAGEQVQALSASVQDLESAFMQASKETGVPVEILKAVGYLESGLHQIGPTVDYGYGIMHLVDNEYAQTLKEAAAVSGLSEEVIKSDPSANIKAGAALIAKYAKETVGTPKSLEDYFEALKKFTGLFSERIQASQASEYYRVMKEGFSASNGMSMSGTSVDISGKVAVTAELLSEDYPPAIWNPADPSNYSSRQGTAIDRWVNHWIGVGTYAGAISWFQNPSSNVSAHFVCRASDGQMTQMVRFADKAWHCGTWNARSIGIENEATTTHPEYWNSTPMLTASSDACRYVCDLYQFPKTRTYIVGHKEVPDASTSCPGNLPWDTYMLMVNNGTPVPTSTPTNTIAGEWIVDNADAGFTVLSGVWSTGTSSVDKYRTDYRYTTSGGTGADQAQFTANVTSTGSYQVYCWYPQGTNRATDAEFRINHNSGTLVVDVNQQTNGGQWNLMGTVNLNSGNNTVLVTDNGSDGTKVVMADAIRWVLIGSPTDTPTDTPTRTPSNTPTDTPTLAPTDTPTDGGPEVVDITYTYFQGGKDELTVRATSNYQPNVTLTLVGYGTMSWTGSYYQYQEKKVSSPGGSVTVTSSGGGSDTESVPYP